MTTPMTSTLEPGAWLQPTSHRVEVMGPLYVQGSPVVTREQLREEVVRQVRTETALSSAFGIIAALVLWKSARSLYRAARTREWMARQPGASGGPFREQRAPARANTTDPSRFDFDAEAAFEEMIPGLTQNPRPPRPAPTSVPGAGRARER